MPIAPDHLTCIAVTAFEARCLAVIDDVARGRTGPVVVFKRNRPFAVIVPIDHEPPALRGAMRGSVTVSPDTDIIAGTDEIWDACLMSASNPKRTVGPGPHTSGFLVTQLYNGA